jgi:hypothetical protein
LRLRYLLAVVLVLPLAAASPAAAQPTSPEAAARQHFEEGTKLFNLGEFAHAVVEYKLAYKAKGDPVFLYNIAQAYRLSGDLQNAVFFYRSYLRNHPSAANRREVEGRVRNLEQQLQQQKVVTTTPPNSAVAPGGAAAATAPEPATETATTAPATTPTTTTTTTTTPTTTTTSTSTSTSTTTTESRGDLVATGPRDAGTPVYKKWWLWTVVGVAVVGVGVGLGVGLGTSHAPSSHFGTTTVSF